ncbi:MAG: NAD-dependent succinate-semialdehyde dehydrogenase [Phycisphaerales bacterium]|nr:NAD-dependent succinate-semialdehyde dehydrogenase [Phycisphaerales bacterium]
MSGEHTGEVVGALVGPDRVRGSRPALVIRDPATDEVIARVASLERAESGRAIDHAAAALGPWRARTAMDRASCLDRLAALMRRDKERLALLMTREQGKPLAEARGEIEYAVSFLDWASLEGRRLGGEVIPASVPGKRLLALRQPVGVCAIITPWNFPSAMITRKIGPALACGCTVVVKPAEQTPLSALAIGELALEAGIPPGVVNIVTGAPAEVAAPFFEHPAVRKVSFTGSTEVGRVLMAQASGRVLRVSLELGGHAPFIVFDDADLEAAARGACACKFRNAGQACISANRFLVQRRVATEFSGRLAMLMGDLRAGRGSEPGVSIGPLIDDHALAKVEAHVEDARARGGRVVRGGTRLALRGLADRFYAPTLIEGATSDMRMWQEETFGPVAPVRVFEHESEAVALANDTEYGLAAYAFTRDAARAWRVAEGLEYGIVGVNDALPSTAQAPFGGMKQSGLGREGGHWVMDEYTELKYVCWGG